MDLEHLGWNEYWKQEFDRLDTNGVIPARVARVDRDLYTLLSGAGMLRAGISGRMRHHLDTRAAFPAVGDWAAVQQHGVDASATIHALLPRRSRFVRKAVLGGGNPDEGGKTAAQVVAANVDTALLVCGLDGDFNLRRIERYVAVAWDSGANPVIVLNKTDICENVAARVAEVEAIAVGVPIVPVCARDGTGLEALGEQITAGQTAVLLGSSGVGKSSLINQLVGEERMVVKAIREDDSHGRHTTTHRELIVLPSGGVIIDTPGMRELQPWSNDEGLTQTFADVEEVAAQCRFRDCRHNGEPDCAIRVALADGTLDGGRYRGYQRLQREQAHLARRQDQYAQMVERDRWKKIIMTHRKRHKARGM